MKELALRLDYLENKSQTLSESLQGTITNHKLLTLKTGVEGLVREIKWCNELIKKK